MRSVAPAWPTIAVGLGRTEGQSEVRGEKEEGDILRVMRAREVGEAEDMVSERSGSPASCCVRCRRVEV